MSILTMALLSIILSVARTMLGRFVYMLPIRDHMTIRRVFDNSTHIRGSDDVCKNLAPQSAVS